MIALRILVGVSCVLVGGGWMLLMAIGKGLRSWGRAGSGREDLFTNAAVFAVPVVCVLMLLTTFLPDVRGVMHAVAVVVGLACIVMAWVATQSLGTAALGFAFLGLWLLYYWLAVWR